MRKKVGVVGIELNQLRSKIGANALEASGFNFGNMLFTGACYRQIPGTTHLGFHFDPQQVASDYDAVLIPAANWINFKNDWQWLADALEKTGLPVTVVGLGTQLQSVSQARELPVGTRRLLEVFSNLGDRIGVRGEFTADVLAELDIHNVEVLGCPSLFYYGGVPELRLSGLPEVNSLAVGPTRYDLRKQGYAPDDGDKQRELYRFGLHFADDIYFQSEDYEILVLAREKIIEQKQKLALDYYQIDDASILLNGLLKKGHYHTDIEHWIHDVRKNDLYVGTRIHGVIAASLAGTPAILITHDRRTRELAQSMCVPAIDIEKFRISMMFDLPGLLKQVDFAGFQQRAAVNLEKLINFYDKNGLESRLNK